ncbi:MAG: zf-TFIIB domain-containing protein [Cypionkella sp.]|nr:zf-TFIIB domain-containing protein [Cypionkella sp.]
MRCPIDGETLVMADRNGVEIDYCPKCRGVWLDRGELDKIIERAAAPVANATPVTLIEPGRAAPRQDHSRPFNDRPSNDQSHDRHDDHDDDSRTGKRKRRDSFLSELFDF